MTWSVCPCCQCVAGIANILYHVLVCSVCLRVSVKVWLGEKSTEGDAHTGLRYCSSSELHFRFCRNINISCKKSKA